ncbi:SRPBCC domain-containing protein [Fulvivirgaceae bacterium BMA10]|uniref:SRPBCC domain-containing protein n=1 Tax=Splendidivirga corallicola TaxID=3051826 RepID=A0ABT8KPP8_9BACT|nr:SRPBCC domain-containing protein [Fulvivirgaceae bacterium BMA10]
MTENNDTLDYQTSVLINADKRDVFTALTSQLDEWWGTTDQPYEKVGDIFKISFGGESYWKFKVVEISASHILWKCVESNQDHNLQGIDEEWLGTLLQWKIEEVNRGTELKFKHQGLVPQGVCYGVCSTAWDFYITDSLKNYLEDGKGKPSEK